MTTRSALILPKPVIAAGSTVLPAMPHAPRDVMIQSSTEGRIFGEMCRLIALRKQHVAFAGHTTEVIDTGSNHVYGFVRRHEGENILVLANFTEREQTVDANQIRLYGLDYAFSDLIGGMDVTLGHDLMLQPYQYLWLTPR